VAETPLAWRRTSSPEFVDRLEETIESTVEDDEYVIRWSCPRCGHESVDRQIPEGAFVGLDAGPTKTGEPRYLILTLLCSCGFEHPGAPSDESGCGFYADLPVERP
jgi:hypothetical protein